MNFCRFWQRRSGKGSFDRELLGIDLFSQLSYMSAVATAGVLRSQVFEYASRLPYVSSRYLRDIHLLSQKLNYDYAEACRMVGEAAEEEEVRNLFLRLSGSLSSGEPERDFLAREAQAMGETYGNEYERRLESLKKWTDGYVALIVSAALIIIVAVISMMIYQVGTTFILGVAGLMILITLAGSWLIYRTAPKEKKTHSLPQRSREQRLARNLFKICLPLAVVGCPLLALLKVNIGWILALGGILLLPVGLVSLRDDRRIDRRDGDIAAFLRTLGGVTGAIGTTITEALGRMDLRATGSLAPEVNRLRVRLSSGIKPELCWQRFVAETGSEQVDRTVRVFWDGISLGGEPEQVGNRASLYAMKIALLRAKRRLVSSTFGWLSIPMHGAIGGLLVFIVEVMGIFGRTVQGMMPTGSPGAFSGLPATRLFTFHLEDLQLLNWLVILVLVVLTGANAFAAKAADGGHPYKLFYYLSIMLAISGGCLIFIPRLATMIFTTVPAM
ncbi:MAG TPA: archaellar assembly protein FlaJ [Dehalococcoidia bacterium]|jgi:flagellar protein FlaJ|nr:archaellar assembly protein FlaJ [Dehalococcoidia bacterium]